MIRPRTPPRSCSVSASSKTSPVRPRTVRAGERSHTWQFCSNHVSSAFLMCSLFVRYLERSERDRQKKKKYWNGIREQLLIPAAGSGRRLSPRFRRAAQPAGKLRRRGPQRRRLAPSRPLSGARTPRSRLGAGPPVQRRSGRRFLETPTPPSCSTVLWCSLLNCRSTRFL